jgi:hypothetical protein
MYIFLKGDSLQTTPRAALIRSAYVAFLDITDWKRICAEYKKSSIKIQNKTQQRNTRAIPIN